MVFNVVLACGRSCIFQRVSTKFYACAFILSLPKNIFWIIVEYSCSARENILGVRRARVCWGRYFNSLLEASFFQLTLIVNMWIFEKSIVDVFFAGAGWVLHFGVWYLFSVFNRVCRVRIWNVSEIASLNLSEYRFKLSAHRVKIHRFWSNVCIWWYSM